MARQGLVTWIIRWCERPGLYLAGPSDKGEPDIGNLLLLVGGYITGAGHLTEAPLSAGQADAAEEWNQFHIWMQHQRPRYVREGTAWLGDVVLEEAGGDHWKAAEEFKRLAEEYLTQEPGTSSD
jgi:hypothetical protein